MKINIIGGGPAGMYFAILMKSADATNDITIYERNGPDDTFGWGVVFSGKTLRNLLEADELSHAAITRNFSAWDNVDVVHRDQKISVHGNSFSGIARLRLLSRGWKEILPGDALRELALRLLCEYPVRAADSLQLAASLTWCESHPTRRSFVCADQRLSDAAKSAGFSVIELRMAVS